MKLVTLVEAYVRYLRRHGLVDHWLRVGATSLNLYNVWREDEELKRIFKRFSDLVEFVRDLRVYGITYTYYFIYEEERAHSISILVATAREILGPQRLAELLKG